MNLLTNLLFYVTGWVIVFLVLSWIVASLYPLMSDMLVNTKADQAAFVILVYGLLPVAVAFVSMIVLSIPELAFSFVADHCHGTDCTPHGLQVALDSAHSITMVSILMGVLIGVLLLISRQLVISHNKLHALSLLAERSPSSYKILESKAMLAWCAGLIKPQIYISSRVAESLTPEQLQVVLTHEETHVKRKDNLRKWILYWATIAWPGKFRLQIRRELADYTEQVCDSITVEYHKVSMDISEVFAILEKCYPQSEASHEPETETELKNRFRQLNLAWHEKVTKTTELTHYLPTVFIGSLWMLSIAFTVRIGHPVLEWLSI